MTESCIEADVLVIGGGLAGMRAAIEANLLGATVVLAVKGKLAKSGSGVSAYHGAGIGPWSEPGDNKECHLRDVIKAGGYLADQELCKIMIDEVPDRLIELERFGLYWERKKDGGLDAYLGAGHSAARTISTRLRQSGLSMVNALKAEIIHRKIVVLEDIMVTKLFSQSGVVVGATGLDYVNGEFMYFKAKSIVLATGCASKVFPVYTPPPECTGDGQAMAYRLGAELMNMEHVVYVFSLARPATWNAIIVPTLFKVGDDVFHLLNKKGERYLERYDPENLEMATKDVIARAGYTEIKEGRAGEGNILYADLRHLPYEEVQQKLGSIVSCMEEIGLDVRKDLVEISPTAHETVGGVRINAKGESTVPGLYAAGSVIAAVYGNDGIPGRGTGHALVFGKRAGEYAAKRAREIRMPLIEWEQVDTERERVFKLLTGKQGVSPIAALKNLQGIMGEHFWISKNEVGMKKALREIARLREEDIPRLCVSSGTRRYNLEWLLALELGNMVDVSEMMVRSALVRKESRTMFLREDYPEQDNDNWLKNVVVRKQNGQMSLSTKPVKLTYVQPEE